MVVEQVAMDLGVRHRRGLAAPQIEQIVAALAADPNNPDQIAEAWNLAMSRMTRWRQTLRDGAVDPALRALTNDCEKQVALLIADDHGLPADLWMHTAQHLRSRCQWLHDFVNCSVILDKLETTMNSMTACAGFATGMQHVREYASLGEADQLNALEEIQQAFAAHSGQITSTDDAAPVEALLEELADVNQISPVAAAAGFALASAMPAAKEGAPAWRLASSWRATMRAVGFIKHHQNITELTGSADDDGDILFGQCLASLRTWKQNLGSDASGRTSSSAALGPRSFLQDVLGKDTQHLSTAVEQVEKWVRQRVQKHTGSKRDALIAVIVKLEDIAGGKIGEAVGKRSWGPNHLGRTCLARRSTT